MSFFFFQINFFRYSKKQNTKEIDTNAAKHYFEKHQSANMVASQKWRTFNSTAKSTIILFILSTNIMAAWSRGFADLPLKTIGDSVHIDTNVDFKPGKCVPVPFNQTVTKRGCVSVKIRNNFVLRGVRINVYSVWKPNAEFHKTRNFFRLSTLHAEQISTDPDSNVLPGTSSKAPDEKSFANSRM